MLSAVGTGHRAISRSSGLESSGYDDSDDEDEESHEDSPGLQSAAINSFDVESVIFQGKNAHEKRDILTEHVKKELLRMKWIKSESSRVPWASMTSLCWQNGYYWDGVPLEVKWKEFRLMHTSGPCPTVSPRFFDIVTTDDNSD